MRIENRMQLQLWREECKEKRQKENCCILVCGGTGCLAGGSDKIYARLKELTSNMDHVTVKIGEEIAHVGLKMSGCHGFCEMGPLVRIEPYNYLYLKVKLEDCEEIFEKTILHGEPVTRLMYEDNGHVYQTQEEIPFYAKQTRLVLRNCGHIDAEHIEDARFFMNFTQRESCGKCVPCREGTKRMLEILERIVAGNGEMSDLDELEELADMIENTALCGLGKSAPKPVVSTIHAFRKEYEEHIIDKKCRAGVCSNLRVFKIDPEKCKGCSKCAKNCPVNAITGKIKSPFTIDHSKCIKCGSCIDNCPFGAVYTE